MLKNMCQVGQGGASHWITQAGNHGIVKVINLELVLTHVTMNQMAKFKNIFAHFVWLGHPEKECPHKKNSKNEQAAAHH